MNLIEAFTGCEMESAYTAFVFDPAAGATDAHRGLGPEAFQIREHSDCLARQFCGPARPFTIDIVPSTPVIGTFRPVTRETFHSHPDALHLERPFRCTVCCLWRPVVFMSQRSAGRFATITNPCTRACRRARLPRCAWAPLSLVSPAASRVSPAAPPLARTASAPSPHPLPGSLACSAVCSYRFDITAAAPDDGGTGAVSAAVKTPGEKLYTVSGTCCQPAGARRRCRWRGALWRLRLPAISRARSVAVARPRSLVLLPVRRVRASAPARVRC